ncbi:hypothetical protein HanPSC8_Chr10g0436351 [Helianthus annuus]|nr:hypothetical protein HanPSC8_Chr10g0436351 [Helianthus annuus]
MRNVRHRLLCGIKITINCKTIRISNMCSRQDMRICDNLIPGSFIIRKNHSNCPSQSCFLTFVDARIISPKTH